MRNRYLVKPFAVAELISRIKALLRRPGHALGITLEAGNLAFIFERFWRGRDVRRPGAGLGLAIVAEIVKAHRAQIQVSAAPGGGAVFVMKFPVEPDGT